MNEKEKLLLKLLKNRYYKASELVAILNLNDARDLRKLVQRLRSRGYFIHSDKNGYKLAKTKQEIEHYLKQAITMLKTYYSMLKNAGNDLNLKLFMNEDQLI